MELQFASSLFLQHDVFFFNQSKTMTAWEELLIKPGSAVSYVQQDKLMHRLTCHLHSQIALKLTVLQARECLLKSPLLRQKECDYMWSSSVSRVFLWSRLFTISHDCFSSNDAFLRLKRLMVLARLSLFVILRINRAQIDAYTRSTPYKGGAKRSTYLICSMYYHERLWANRQYFVEIK